MTERSGTEAQASHVPVLLLDAAWRIDRVINEQRACELVLDQKVIPASPEIATVMRSPSIEVPIPSVVARIGKHYAGGRTPSCSSLSVRQRDLHVCQFVIDGVPCDHRGDSVDHLIPKSMGGLSTWTNLVASCKFHNNVKSDRMLTAIGWKLRRPPYRPSRHELMSARLANVDRPEWKPFLSTV